MATYRKVYSTVGSFEYVSKRKPRKHQAEMALLDKVFKHIPKGGHILDCPCGGGRVSVHLSGKGYQVTAADVSPAMLALARDNFGARQLKIAVEQEDLEALSYQDRAFDATICFRLFHHLPEPGIRRLMIRELCRVTSTQVALSYISPVAFTSAYRRIVRTLTGKQSKKWSTPLPEIESYFKENGFQLIRDFAQLPLVHTLHVALFRRIT